jgi:CubicO group peptidase (beta-lactamase class C family)
MDPRMSGRPLELDTHYAEVDARETIDEMTMPAKLMGWAVLLSLALAALSVSTPQPAVAQASVAPSKAEPQFRPDGHNAEAYGSNEGYPRCAGLAFIREERCRVGAFSHFDTLFPARTIAAAKTASPLRRASGLPVIRYTFGGEERTLEQYLDRRPVTGLLIAKGDAILFERYQYSRTDRHRLTSFSMAKTIVGLLIGIAIEEGLIRSIDDLAETYVPDLKDTAYGRTPIKALLQMRSGVFFREDYADMTSDIYTLARLTLEQDAAGSLAAVRRFDWRRAEPGTYHSYSSADTVALGLVLAAAAGRTVSDYASEKLWQPLGAEADASWIIDATGQEVTFAYVNAVLRDWARLGLMLAHDGIWAGRTVVPRNWLMASRANAGETGSPFTKYGYHIWVSADQKRYFLWGLRGQFVFADPESKLVMVHTALSNNDFLDLELTTLWTAARAQLQ